MRTPMVAGNWKMNGTLESVNSLMRDISLGAKNYPGVDILVFPAFVHLSYVKSVISKKSDEVGLGAQNISSEPGGAFTGEVSGLMLSDLGCKYVLIGHSERRLIMGESDLDVAGKFAAAQHSGLTPILCVGETLEQRQSGEALDVIEAQLFTVIKAVGIESFNNAVVAYEPVWAIGTGETAQPDQAQEIHAALRNMVASQSAKIAEQLRLLYGGSCNASNADDLFKMSDIDGGLIGGASLKASDFISIVKAAKKLI
ncbi:MAG: triose-phosphate isomerase [Pseudomonadota bacterium]|nr:triose-phosphate isomerase [Pseudomonadota bacterium]